MNHTSTRPQPYGSAEEIETVVRRFEDCAFEAGEFKHREHLTVALWYLSTLGDAEAADRMRTGLYKFLAHHGHDLQKYHETITLFWLKRLRALLNQEAKQRPLAETANEIIEVCDDAQFIFTYYSRELINSTAAREGWAEPDLRPLDF